MKKVHREDTFREAWQDGRSINALNWLSLDNCTQLTHLCTMHTRLLNALGTLR